MTPKLKQTDRALLTELAESYRQLVTQNATIEVLTHRCQCLERDLDSAMRIIGRLTVNRLHQIQKDLPSRS